MKILQLIKIQTSQAIQNHGQLVKLYVCDRINVFGDLHGQFDDLLGWLNVIGDPHHTHEQYLFLGDYVDRGQHDVETILFLLIYNYLYPKRFVLLRGNHECYQQNSHYGFKQNCKMHFNTNGLIIWKLINEIFNNLPRCALIDDTILCMHGGVSPHMLQSDFELDNLHEMKSDRGDADFGILTDLFWADPHTNLRGFKPNDRGISYAFGRDVVKRIHKKHNTSLIVRAHQVIHEGYEYFDPGLLTIFSAPNYTGTMSNNAAVLQVDNKLNTNLIVVDKHSRTNARNFTNHCTER